MAVECALPTAHLTPWVGWPQTPPQRSLTSSRQAYIKYAANPGAAGAAYGFMHTKASSGHYNGHQRSTPPSSSRTLSRTTGPHGRSASQHRQQQYSTSSRGLHGAYSTPTNGVPAMPRLHDPHRHQHQSHQHQHHNQQQPQQQPQQQYSQRHLASHNGDISQQSSRSRTSSRSSRSTHHRRSEPPSHTTPPRDRGSVATNPAPPTASAPTGGASAPMKRRASPQSQPTPTPPPASSSSSSTPPLPKTTEQSLEERRLGEVGLNLFAMTVAHPPTSPTSPHNSAAAAADTVAAARQSKKPASSTATPSPPAQHLPTAPRARTAAAGSTRSLHGRSASSGTAEGRASTRNRAPRRSSTTAVELGTSGAGEGTKSRRGSIVDVDSARAAAKKRVAARKREHDRSIKVPHTRSVLYLTRTGCFAHTPPTRNPHRGLLQLQKPRQQLTKHSRPRLPRRLPQHRHVCWQQHGNSGLSSNARRLPSRHTGRQ